LVGILRRSAMGLCIAVAAIALPLGSTQAAGPQPSGTTHSGPDVSTPAAVYAVTHSHAAELSAFQLDLQVARPFLSVDQNGFFHVSAAYKARSGGVDLRVRLNAINGQLQGLRDQQQRADMLRAAGLSISAEAWWCYYIPNWALDAYAYLIIIEGGVEATAALFISGTIIGLPAGAVLGALGIWTGLTGGFLLWYFDKYYPNGVWICR
jgi:hypothetical protein